MCVYTDHIAFQVIEIQFDHHEGQARKTHIPGEHRETQRDLGTAINVI